MENSSLSLVLVTVPDEETGKSIAHELVKSRLAACVNIIPGITSIYRWEGSVEEDTEAMLVIKARSDNFQALSKKITTLHEYDTPEIVQLSPNQVSDKYLRWFLKETS